MYYTYILTNFKKTVLYTGVTNNLIRRIDEHYSKKGTTQSFTGRYNCHNLVYYEEYIYIKDAIAREKAIKHWPRSWKENLVNKVNPGWIFLNNTLFDQWPPTGNRISHTSSTKIHSSVKHRHSQNSVC